MDALKAQNLAASDKYMHYLSAMRLNGSLEVWVLLLRWEEIPNMPLLSTELQARDI